jgi:dihydroneopterin aldolase
MRQQIVIDGLRICCHVGVPDEELAVAQELLLHILLEPLADWDQLNDDITRTIDYAAVVHELESLACARPRRLIETLAVDAVDFLMANYPLQSAKVTIEKFILSQTRAVAVVVEKNC